MKASEGLFDDTEHPGNPNMAPDNSDWEFRSRILIGNCVHESLAQQKTRKEWTYEITLRTREQRQEKDRKGTLDA
ncbi:hypothetical protein MRB53_018518 [Persea americana]|uniref:Uncharacterized protein n=1 Tax=Persea americana TaxID=3435 RepID=A0ACC2M890_PERAE|nr:hypothetical protein MRB53_018518 [Persea americana]